MELEPRPRAVRRQTAPLVIAVPVLLLVTVMVAACGSTESGGDVGPDTVSAEQVAETTAVPAVITEPETTDVSSSSESPTTVEMTTTVPVPPTAPPTVPSTTTPPITEPVLFAAAVGTLEIGIATVDDAIALLAPFVGPPAANDATAYPDGTDGSFENEALESGFAFPYGRTVCFVNELCLHFGGLDEGSLRLAGYRQADGPGAFATVSGVTAGSIGADFPTVIVTEEGGCYSSGGGTADGVAVDLLSYGIPFLEIISDTGEYVLHAPPVDDVTVFSVHGGNEPFFLYDDC